MALPNPSLKILPVLATEPFVGFGGLDPGSVSRFSNKPRTTGPFRNGLLAQVKVSPEVVWEGVGTRFLHPERERERFE